MVTKFCSTSDISIWSAIYNLNKIWSHKLQHVTLMYLSYLISFFSLESQFQPPHTQLSSLEFKRINGERHLGHKTPYWIVGTFGAL